jgi:hypothetical protein
VAGPVRSATSETESSSFGLRPETSLPSQVQGEQASSSGLRPQEQDVGTGWQLSVTGAKLNLRPGSAAKAKAGSLVSSEFQTAECATRARAGQGSSGVSTGIVKASPIQVETGKPECPVVATRVTVGNASAPTTSFGESV